MADECIVRGVTGFFINSVEIRISEEPITHTPFNFSREIVAGGVLKETPKMFSITVPKLWLPASWELQDLAECNLLVQVETRGRVITLQNAAMTGDFTDAFDASDDSLNGLSFAAESALFSKV